MVNDDRAHELTPATVPAELRQDGIRDVVLERGFVRVADLADAFGVSTVTVRSDLQSLEGRGALRRVRGGAVAGTTVHVEQPFEVAQQDLALDKAHIGAYAADLVSDGDTVILDVGTTTTAIGRALIARQRLRDVTIFTNALNIAVDLERAADRFQVVVTGGTLRPLQHSLVNPLGTLLLERVHATLAFIGCNGVDVVAGATNINLPEAEIKRAMLLAAHRPVLVADASKLGEIELAKICDVAEASLLVTSGTADPDIVRDLECAGIEVAMA